MADNLDTVLARIKKQEGRAYLQTGRIKLARTRYAESCRLNPADAGAWLMLGNMNARLGDLDEAETAYREAVERDPQLGEAHQFLGNLLGTRGRFAEAAASYRRALQIKPESIPAHINLGTSLIVQGRLDEAMEVYNSALRHDPSCRKAAVGIAHVLQRQGHAEQSYARLKPFLDTGDVDVDVAMIFAAQCRPLGRCDEAIVLLKKLLKDGAASLGDEQRSAVHFRLGQLYDARDEFDAAFEQFRAANDAKAKSFRFDPRAHARNIAAHMDVYTPEFMSRAPRARHGSERPVFIVGMPRSGTSLVQRILASHPDAFGAGELLEIRRIATELPSALGTDTPYPRCVQEMTPDQCDEQAKRYLDHIAQLAPPGAQRVTDDMPANFLHLGLIALLFPHARIIHCVRDPLDTCLSCYFQNFGPVNAYSFDLGHVGEFCRQYQLLMDHWGKVLDLPVMQVRYEDLVGDQEDVSRALVQFCGLEWDERCLSFHLTEQAAATASYDQVRQFPFAQSVGRARHYAAHLEPLRRALAGEQDTPG